MSEGFKFWKMCWDFKAIEIDMLKKAVKLKDLKKEEFKTITGQEYTED